jgi:hypothetical protein
MPFAERKVKSVLAFCATRSESLGRTKGKVFNIICVQVVCLCAGRALVDSCQAIPSNTVGVSAAGVFEIKNAMVHTSFIQTLRVCIPYKFSHVCILLLII